MFRIKICGITNVEDAIAAADAGADAIGLNFYPGSKRVVSRDQAERIVAALPKRIVKVGLFVNAPADEIIATTDQLRLDLIQLHGDESPQDMVALGDRPIMKALRPVPGGAIETTLMAAILYLTDCARLGAKPRLVLLDAAVAGEYGGTGQRANWEIAIRYRDSLRVPPLVLAGGLTAENVADAIRTVRPAAVDTSSGVESSPGRKDSQKVANFIAAARCVCRE